MKWILCHGIQLWRNPLQKLPTSKKVESIRLRTSCVCESHIASLTFSTKTDRGYIRHWCDSCNYETQNPLWLYNGMLIFSSVKLLPFAAIIVLRVSKRLFSQRHLSSQARYSGKQILRKWLAKHSSCNPKLDYIISLLRVKHDWEQILKPQTFASILVMSENKHDLSNLNKSSWEYSG
jgi:hypothetical protein